MFPTYNSINSEIYITYVNRDAETFGQLCAGFPVDFAHNFSIRKVVAPDVTVVGSNTFLQAESMTDAEMPFLRHVGAGAFEDCTALSCVFANGIDTMNGYMTQTIGDRAFIYCNNLRGFNGRFVESVGEDAFYGCGSLADINLPLLNNRLSIGDNFAYSCNELERIWTPQAKKNSRLEYSSKLSAFCHYVDYPFEYASLPN